MNVNKCVPLRPVFESLTGAAAKEGVAVFLSAVPDNPEQQAHICEHGRPPAGVHAMERWRSLQAEKRGDMGCGPWEWQGTFLYHLELGTDLLLHTLTLGHYLHLWLVHGEWEKGSAV